MNAQSQAGAVAWRCDGRFPEGDGGVTHITKYAKTRQEMLIFRDQGYTCTPLHDESAAVPVEALEGLVAKWQKEADEEIDGVAALLTIYKIDELTRFITAHSEHKERSNG